MTPKGILAFESLLIVFSSLVLNGASSRCWLSKLDICIGIRAFRSWAFLAEPWSAMMANLLAIAKVLAAALASFSAVASLDDLVEGAV